MLECFREHRSDSDIKDPLRTRLGCHNEDRDTLFFFPLSARSLPAAELLPVSHKTGEHNVFLYFMLAAHCFIVSLGCCGFVGLLW